MFDIDFGYYIVTGIGAFMLYFKLKSDGKDVIEFLPVIKKEWKLNTKAKFLDAIIFTIMGALIG